jgi:hypothetical protein
MMAWSKKKNSQQAIFITRPRVNAFLSCVAQFCFYFKYFSQMIVHRSEGKLKKLKILPGVGI